MKKINVFALIALIFALLTVTFFTVRSLVGESDPDASLDADLSLVSERAYNVLVIGTDREAGLSDVIMLVRLDLSGKRAAIVQIPRDTYAEYTDASYKKINGAYSSIGADGTCDFLSDAFGISVDRYVVVGLDTLKTVVDAIGGVDVNVPCDMRYRDKAQDLYIDLKAGIQHLDGEAAEQFLRFRSGYIEGDIDRMDAQKIFLAAAAKKLKDEFSLPMAYRLLDAADGVETNFSAAELLNIAVDMADMESDRVVMLTLPGAEARALSGASYYSVSGKSAADVFARYFGASVDGFDKKRLLLNEQNVSFRNIYNAADDYKAYTLDDIAQNGIEIDLK